MYFEELSTRVSAFEGFGLVRPQSFVEPSDRVRNFSIRPVRLEYDAYAAAIREIAQLHRRGKIHPGGLLLTGHSGAGKSAVLKFYAQAFPPRDEPERTVTPVLFVETPSTPTVKTFAKAILRALGDPAYDKGTADQKTDRIYIFLQKCKVDLLLIDEFQHFEESVRRCAALEVTDWLKLLIEIAQIPVVAAGLPMCAQTIERNDQLTRRFSAHYYLRPFSFDTEDNRVEFRGVLKSLQEKIPVPCIPLHDANIARRFFIASNGVIDYVAKLIDAAVLKAAYTDAGEITMEIFSEVFKSKIWARTTEELNPFSVKAILRPLTCHKEPFEKHVTASEPRQSRTRRK